MRSTIRSHPLAATCLLGSTLVYALPQSYQLQRRQDEFDVGIDIVSGSAPPVAPDPTPAPAPSANDSQGNSTPDPPLDATVTTRPPSDDTVTQSSQRTDASISTTSGSLPNTLDTLLTALDAPPTTTLSGNGILAPTPTVAPSKGGHGLLTGVVAGGLVLGLLLLTLGLWLCYRRRGPNSGASTPKYTTTVVGDEKPKTAFAFLRGGNLPWKKSHSRIRSSLSFASPILDAEPKMVESASSSRSPLAPHLSGSTTTRADWKDARWSTFSSSDGSVYPQTPVGRHLSGIVMETVVETDAVSSTQTPPMAVRRDASADYLVLQRSADTKLPPLTTNFDPRVSTPATTRYSDDTATPTTTVSGRTFGSAGHGSSYARLYHPPALSTQFANHSGSLRSGSTGTALLNARPKFNVTYPNGSEPVSIGQESGETIKITNPFLDDEDELSSYGHGMIEAEDLDVDGRSLRSIDSRAHGAYPSSTGCLDPKIGPSPTPDDATTRPQSSLNSDSSSDCPYPLGYVIDEDGNVANPFLRISELLEEVDGRMRWPSPPLLPRAESRNY